MTTIVGFKENADSDAIGNEVKIVEVEDASGSILEYLKRALFRLKPTDQ